MLWEIEGVRVGNVTDESARTGCTAVVLPPETVASGEVRGGAPATRDFELLDPRRLVQHVDAVLLTGGSAFGLAAVDGTARWLAENDRGFMTAGGRVPIVVGLSLYDLAEGDGSVRPDAPMGYAAAVDAAAAPHVELGRVGAAAGATVSKWRDRDLAQPGGLGAAVVRSGSLAVAALIAVNAAGDPDDGATHAAIRAGTFVAPEVTDEDRFGDEGESGEGVVTNTTIGVIVTNASLDKIGCRLVAESGHDGMARALVPTHTRGDGDALVAAATGAVQAELPIVRLLATIAVEDAIRNAVPA